MLLSVIIPTFNRAHCIHRALASVAAQHGMDAVEMEVIIGDDASTDDTLAEAALIMPTVRIVRLPDNRGAAAARNAAMKEARGEFLAFLDSDDEWLPGKLERQLAYLREHLECAAIGTGHFLETCQGERIAFPGRNPDEWRRELHTAQSFHGASTPLVRRTVLESVGLQDEELRVLEDWDWMLRIAKRHPIHVLPEMLTVIHENTPSDPLRTAQATERFLVKHREEFLYYGTSHAGQVVSQHYENAARNLFRHGYLGEGVSMLWKSVRSAPLRNPVRLAAFPLALLDHLAGTKILPAVLARRSRLPLRKAD